MRPRPRLGVLGFVATLAGLALACARPPVPEPPAGAPRLVLMLVVDQLGGEHLERFDQAFTGGLRWLVDEGVRFTEAHHAHAGTSTSPGHATIATGCHPSSHGIISNYWIDPATGESVYSVEDERYERAPTRLERDTLGDWLKQRYRTSRVFSLSGKDRSAILLGGRNADGAYWYNWDGTFASSGYYRESNPAWLSERNAEGYLASKYGQVWSPLPFAVEDLAGMGVTDYDLGPLEEDFPHPIGGLSPAPGDYYFDEVFDSPWMDEYMLRLARAVIEAEELGADRIPDLLALAFSTSDAVGHGHGPDSREFFDILVRLDRRLGEFFDWLDEAVGMENVAIALSSDHGSVPVPEIRIEQGLPARRAGEAEIRCLQSVGAELDKEFGGGNWFRPGPFFAPLPPGSDLAVTELHERTRALIEACPSVAKVWMAEDIGREALADADPMKVAFARSFFPGRSPDFAIQWDEYFLGSARNASSHGTPHRYDTHVPLILRHPSQASGDSAVPVQTVDIAPTLAEWVGVEPPQPIDGRSLSGLVAAAGSRGR